VPGGRKESSDRGTRIIRKMRRGGSFLAAREEQRKTPILSLSKASLLAKPGSTIEKRHEHKILPGT